MKWRACGRIKTRWPAVIQPPPPAPPAPPTTSEVATAVTDAMAKKQLPKFQLLGMNVGANSDGNATFTGKGPLLRAVREQLCVPVGRRVLL